MTTKPLITCGVTAFNAEDTIKRAVASTLAQSYRPIEVVVVDDCSADRTIEILAQLAAHHPEVRLFRQVKNSGVADSRNRIIEEARGEFIAFFDDDDESFPERLGVQIKRIFEYERDFAKGAPVICHAARIITFPDGHTQIARALGEKEHVAAPSGPAVARAILGVDRLQFGQAGAAATCSQMARRAVYNFLGGFDAEFRRHEDDDFAIRAALAGGHFVGVAAPVVVQALTATSDKSLIDQHRYALKLLEKHSAFLEIENNYLFARRYYEAQFAFMAGHYGRFAASIFIATLMKPQLVISRVFSALPNIALNRRMGRFYLKGMACL